MQFESLFQSPVTINYLIIRVTIYWCHHVLNFQIDRSGGSTSESEVSDDEEPEVSLQLFTKKNTTSKVSVYFGFVPDEDGNPIDKCKLCSKSVSAKWENISNLLSHLKFSHTTEYREVHQTEQRQFQIIDTKKKRQEITGKWPANFNRVCSENQSIWYKFKRAL